MKSTRAGYGFEIYAFGARLNFAVMALVLALRAGAASPAVRHVAVADHFGGPLLRFDAATGAPLGGFGLLPSPLSELTAGPEGHVYATVFSHSGDFRIVRVN